MTTRSRSMGHVLVAGASSAVLAALVLVAGARSQGPGAPVSKDAKGKIFTNKTVFFLPVKIEDRVRGTLKEVCLYVKQAGADWVRQETGVPTLDKFTYKVPQDGEYWFSVVTIDRVGRANPADVGKEAPSLMVVVDTQPPTLDLQPEGDQFVRCTMQDGHPDPSTMRVTVQAGDQPERPLEQVPNTPGLFRLPAGVVGGKLRVSASDQCGNLAVREMRVQENLPASVNVPPPSPPLPTTRNEALPPVSLPLTKNEPIPQAPLLPRNDGAMVSQMSYRPESSPAASTTTNIAPPPMPSMSSAPSNPPSAPNQAAAKGGPARQILNTTRAMIDFRIEQVGPSGVGKVEVYITGDQGQSWTRICEKADRRGPIEVDLPGEGLFGLRLVVTNGNGFGGVPPQRGDTPTSWIEVDTTLPFVHLREPDPQNNAGALDVRWNANDKNLGAEPISLYYRISRDGPWQLIARHLKNDGIYRWDFPRDKGPQFFLRIEVTDLAGNVARTETTNAVVLDLTEPRATVVNITPVVSGQATPLLGN